MAESFDGSPEQAPLLEIVYENGEPVVDTTPPSTPSNLASPGQTRTNIDLSWDPASDDVGVTSYRVYENGALLTTTGDTAAVIQDLSPSTEYAFQVSALDAAGNESAPSAVFSASTGDGSSPVSLRIRVSGQLDDAEEEIARGGSMTLSSSNLELTEDGSSSARAVGVRFQEVGIPKGAIVTTAYVQFAVDEAGSVPTSLEIHGQASDDAAAFSSSSGDVTTRPMTVTAVPWSPPPWNTVESAGPDQQTPELKEILQEIVDRSGWNSGQSIALIVTGSGARVAESWDGSFSQAPELVLEYIVP